MYLRIPVNPRTPWIPFLRRAAICFAAVWCTGCLYTTHHFNSGRILEPGETSVTLGYGRAHFQDEYCQGPYNRYQEKANAPMVCRHWSAGGSAENGGGVQPGVDSIIAPVVEEFSTPKFSLGYRLGVRKQWGPLTGIELGWTMEAPTNPATLEFDLKAGLPLPRAWKAAHSLSGGWGIGMWSDNTWFLEWAASKTLGSHTLFGSYRWSNLASQPQDLDSSFSNWKFTHTRRAINQISAGYVFCMPEIVILPDYLAPQATFTFPMLSSFTDVRPSSSRDFDFNINWGFGWDF